MIDFLFGYKHCKRFPYEIYVALSNLKSSSAFINQIKVSITHRYYRNINKNKVKFQYRLPFIVSAIVKVGERNEADTTRLMPDVSDVTRVKLYNSSTFVIAGIRD